MFIFPVQLKRCLMERFHYELNKYQSESLLKDSRLGKGLFLCVLHANKIPPHLGLICDGLFYSSKANGKDEGVPINHVLQIIRKQNITVLFFELNKKLVSPSDVASHFESVPTNIGENMTCLTPIKELLDAPKSVEHIGDLMNYLEHSHLVLARITLHLPKQFSGIPYYTLVDINKRIESLKHDKGQKNIPSTN